MSTKPLRALDIAASKGQTDYPAPFVPVVAGRTKRKLGNAFGLDNFGVNLTHLDPGAASALYHWHAVQDEFVYILAGVATLLFDDAEYTLRAGDCIGFKAGTQLGHQLVNRSDELVTYLEIGDRQPGDHGDYPHDDLVFAVRDDGSVAFTRKDGSPY